MRRLVLNDVGPTIQAEAIAAHRHLPRPAVRWDSVDEAADYMWSISQGFGPHTREQWLALTRPMLKPDGDGFMPHYDPAIAVPFKAFTPEMAAAGEARCGTATTRSAARPCCCAAPTPTCCRRDTAQAMTARGPKAPLLEFAGVGHAPTLVAPDQVAAVQEFPAVAMKTGVLEPRDGVAPILQLIDAGNDAAAESDSDRAGARLCRAAARPAAGHRRRHAGACRRGGGDPQGIGAAPTLQAAAYLVYAADHLNKPEEVVAKAFGAHYAALVVHTRKLVQIQRAARDAKVGHGQRAEQTERVRKMLLAFSRDLRVVLLRLASRLQTLRYFAASKMPCPQPLAAESLQVFAPLANRLGIWQIKWELEDLAFRFLEPETYKAVARLLDEKRVEREQRIEALRDDLRADLAQPRHCRPGAGPAQAHLQHLEEDAGQGA